MPDIRLMNKEQLDELQHKNSVWKARLNHQERLADTDSWKHSYRHERPLRLRHLWEALKRRDLVKLQNAIQQEFNL